MDKNHTTKLVIDLSSTSVIITTPTRRFQTVFYDLSGLHGPSRVTGARLVSNNTPITVIGLFWIKYKEEVMQEFERSEVGRWWCLMIMLGDDC